MPRTIDLQLRREQLAEALWRVITTRGVGAVSVRAVAHEAGVVVGSLRHVFPTRTELLRFSAELMERRAADRILAVPRSADPGRFVLAVLEELLPLTPDSRAEMEINLALITEARAVPELATIRDHAHDRLRELFTQLVEILTDRPPDPELVQQARRLHALVDGLAVHLLHSAATDGAWAVEIVEDEIGRIAASGSG